VINFLKKLLNKNDGSSSPHSGQNLSVEELRLYARFPLGEEVGSVKILDNGQEGKIINLSYGGILINFADRWYEEIGEMDTRSFSASIEILGKTSQTNIQYIHSLPMGAGFSFQHRNVETLVFLREILENFRVGSTLRQPPTDLIREDLKGKGYIYFRGEGPTDLALKNGNNGISANLTFSEGSSYSQLTYKDGIIKTDRAINLSGLVDSISTANSTLDTEILRKSIEILIGASNAEQTSKICESLVEKILPIYVKQR
jgi:hypothetical protein